MDAPLLPGPAYAVLTAVAWAFSVILFKRSGERIHPMGLNSFKNVLALPLFLATFIAAGYHLPDAPWQHYAMLIASGVVGIGIADTLFFHSLNLLGASRAAIVDCTYSPLIVGFSYLLLGETLTPVDAVGASLIVVAVLLTLRRGAGQLDQERLMLGIALGVAAMATMGLAIVWVKPLLDRYDVLFSVIVRLVGGVAMTGVWLVLRKDWRHHTIAAFKPQPAWRVALPGAFLGTYVSMLLWVAGFKHNPANIAAVLNQTNTLFVVLLAWLVLREPMTPRRGAAVSLAFVGSLLVLL